MFGTGGFDDTDDEDFGTMLLVWGNFDGGAIIR